MEKSVSIPVSEMKAMKAMLSDASRSPNDALWTCGAVYVMLQSYLSNSKEELRNETVRNEH